MKTPVWIVVIFAMFLMSSCAPLYVANTRNAAMFRGAGEFQGSAHVGLGLDAQGAASLTNHIGFMGSYSYINRNTYENNNTNNREYLKHSSWEAAIGYYENVEKLCYEIFGGYSNGQGTAYGNYFNFSDAKATGTYDRFFIQPSIGSNSHIFNWIVSPRISYVDFRSQELLSTPSQPSSITIDPDPVIFLEPAFTGRIFFGKSPIYSQFQVGFCFTTQGDTSFDYEPFNFSFGFGFRLGGQPKILKE